MKVYREVLGGVLDDAQGSQKEGLKTSILIPKLKTKVLKMEVPHHVGPEVLHMLKPHCRHEKGG